MVVSDNSGPSDSTSWITDSPFLVSGARQASQMLSKVAYFDLKYGLIASLPALWISACALARAAASSGRMATGVFPVSSIISPPHKLQPSEAGVAIGWFRST